MTVRICARDGCGKPLPPGSAVQRKYCSERCQVRQWRLNHKALERTQGRRTDLKKDNRDE